MFRTLRWIDIHSMPEEWPTANLDKRSRAIATGRIVAARPADWKKRKFLVHQKTWWPDKPAAPATKTSVRFVRRNVPPKVILAAPRIASLVACDSFNSMNVTHYKITSLVTTSTPIKVPEETTASAPTVRLPSTSPSRVRVMVSNQQTDSAPRPRQNPDCFWFRPANKNWIYHSQSLWRP